MKNYYGFLLLANGRYQVGKSVGGKLAVLAKWTSSSKPDTVEFDNVRLIPAAGP